MGARFVLVTLLPNVAFVAGTGALVLAGAPAESPSWDELRTAVTGLSIGGAGLAFALVMVFSIALHPLNFLITQVMEGYWSILPFGTALQELAADRGAAYRRELEARERAGQDVSALLDDLPDDQDEDNPHPVLLSTLGNVLRSGEIRAGLRYGYETRETLDRLLLVAGDGIRAEVNDTRNQVDSAARLCALGLIAVPVTTALLLSHGAWLLVPVGCYVFAWTSYRGAVAAARRFTEALHVIFDLHHLTLWDALSLKRPADLLAEKEDRAPLLSRLFTGHDLSDEQRESFEWQQ